MVRVTFRDGLMFGGYFLANQSLHFIEFEQIGSSSSRRYFNNCNFFYI